MPRSRLLLLLPLLALPACATSDALQPAQSASAFSSARVCDGASETARCVEVADRGQVAALEEAFLTGPTAEEDCPGLDQQVYRVVLVSATSEQLVDVPAACGPTLAPGGYEVTDEERALVRRLLDGR